MEVLDPKKGRWEAVPSTAIKVRDKWMHSRAVIGGRVYAMADQGGVVFYPNNGAWEGVEKRLDLGGEGRLVWCMGFCTAMTIWGKSKGLM